MIGFLHYTVPLSLKILICLSILAAMAIVYFWEPGRKKMNRGNKVTNHALQYLDVDPYLSLAGKENLLRPRNQKVKLSQHMTLQELDEYVRTLKQNKINNLDKV